MDRARRDRQHCFLAQPLKEARDDRDIATCGSDVSRWQYLYYIMKIV